MKCSCCEKEVLEVNLFVVEGKDVYHLSCYNKMKSEEEEK